MSPFDAPKNPAYEQGWNSWLLNKDGDSICPYRERSRSYKLWWEGYKAASKHYAGCPWKRAAARHGVDL